MLDIIEARKYASALQECIEYCRVLKRQIRTSNFLLEGGNTHFCAMLNYNANNNILYTLHENISTDVNRIKPGILVYTSGKLYIPYNTDTTKESSNGFTVLDANSVQDDYFSLSTIHENKILDFALVLQEFDHKELREKDAISIRLFDITLLDKLRKDIRILKNLKSEGLKC